MNLGTQLNVHGIVPMFHVAGVTPEAPDVETAFQGRKDYPVVTVTDEDLAQARREISAGAGKADFCILGCPHLTIGQVGSIAAMLEGQKLAGQLYIFTSTSTRELARRMGADAAVNVKSEDLPTVMHKQGLVEGFDIGLEMSGNGAGLQQMISVMRNGGKISLLGISNKPVPMDMNTIICKGLTMQGIYGRKMDNWHQMSYMVQGGLDLTPVITHRFHYTQFEEGFAAMNSGKSGKVILDWRK